MEGRNRVRGRVGRGGEKGVILGGVLMLHLLYTLLKKIKETIFYQGMA